MVINVAKAPDVDYNTQRGVNLMRQHLSLLNHRRSSVSSEGVTNRGSMTDDTFSISSSVN